MEFMIKLKGLFNFPRDNLLEEDIFEWNIENWEGLTHETTSKIFKLCGLNWNLILYRYGYNQTNEYVSVALENFDALKCYNTDDNFRPIDDNQYNINVPTKFAIYIRQNYDFSKFEAKETNYQFDNTNYYHGIYELVKIKKFNKKLLKNNNKLVVGIYLCRYKNNNEVEFVNKLESYLSNKYEKDNFKQFYKEFEINIDNISKINNKYILGDKYFNIGDNYW
ncbi:hypothetical protein PIROE2DRAFT_19427 [Piromyces sp. E2]|nr:hypothetical protein PIROE2DRAFT_19427 [Piromyces sp. E2]|eukprot:OUM56118.1 hypothetical protein PIROE2DRAFT_19427 [Piromyces sp. E2]